MSNKIKTRNYQLSIIRDYRALNLIATSIEVETKNYANLEDAEFYYHDELSHLEEANITKDVVLDLQLLNREGGVFQTIRLKSNLPETEGKETSNIF